MKFYFEKSTFKNKMQPVLYIGTKQHGMAILHGVLLISSDIGRFEQ